MRSLKQAQALSLKAHVGADETTQTQFAVQIRGAYLTGDAILMAILSVLLVFESKTSLPLTKE